MTQYLFSVIHDYVNNPPIADPVKDADMYARVGAFNESIKDQILFMGGLHAPEAATTCSVSWRCITTFPVCPASTCGTPAPALVVTGGVHVTVVSSAVAITLK